MAPDREGLITPEIAVKMANRDVPLLRNKLPQIARAYYKKRLVKKFTKNGVISAEDRRKIRKAMECADFEPKPPSAPPIVRLREYKVITLPGYSYEVKVSAQLDNFFFAVAMDTKAMRRTSEYPGCTSKLVRVMTATGLTLTHVQTVKSAVRFLACCQDLAEREEQVYERIKAGLTYAGCKQQTWAFSLAQEYLRMWRKKVDVVRDKRAIEQGKFRNARLL